MFGSSGVVLVYAYTKGRDGGLVHRGAAMRQSEGPEPRKHGRRGSSDPIIEADEPSTEVRLTEVVAKTLCTGARPTGGSHDRTTRGPAQRWAKPGRKAQAARERESTKKSAAKDSIKA